MLRTPRLMVRTLRATDASALLAYHERNVAHLAPWQPAPPHGFYTLGYWESYASAEAAEEPSRVRFAAFEGAGADVCALVTVRRIERGIASSALLGYSADARVQGTGMAREAVGAVVDFALGTLGLHRIEANYQPSNERSGKLLRALGFVVEGYARDYLFIDGAWRDHIMTAYTRIERGTRGDGLPPS